MARDGRLSGAIDASLRKVEFAYDHMDEKGEWTIGMHYSRPLNWTHPLFLPVRRGFRAETFVSTFKFKWTTPCRPGLVFGYLDPSNWWAVEIRSTDGKARLIQRTDDGPATVVATDTTALSLTNNTWYTAKVVVEWQPRVVWASCPRDSYTCAEVGGHG